MVNVSLKELDVVFGVRRMSGCLVVFVCFRYWRFYKGSFVIIVVLFVYILRIGTEYGYCLNKKKRVEEGSENGGRKLL